MLTHPVPYLFKEWLENEPLPQGMQEFTYKAIHLPTKQITQKTVYCWNRSNLHTLLCYWNEMGLDMFQWKYIEVNHV